MLIYKVLIKFTLTAVFALLFSSNSLCIPKKQEEIKQNNAKVNSSQYNYKFPSENKFNVTEDCAFSKKMAIITSNHLTKKEYSKLPPYLLHALKHPDNCKQNHSWSGIANILYFIKYNCGEDLINEIVDKLVSNKIKQPDYRMSANCIYRIITTIKEYSGDNVAILRNIAADHILDTNTTFSNWTPSQLVAVPFSFYHCSETKTKDAIKKVVSHILSETNKKNQCTKSNGKMLTLLITNIGETYGYNANNIVKIIANLIVSLNLSLSNCTGECTSFIFKYFSTIYKDISNEAIDDYNPYRAVLQYIIDQIASDKSLTSRWKGNDILKIIRELDILRNMDFITKKAIENISICIAEEIIDVKKWSDSERVEIAAILTYSKTIEAVHDAILHIASYLNHKHINLSHMSHHDLINLSKILMSEDGIRVKNAIQNLANFVSNDKTSLNNWRIGVLIRVAGAISSDFRVRKDQALQKIAREAQKKTDELNCNDYLMLAGFISKSDGDDCQKFILDFIKNKCNKQSYISSLSLPKLICLLGHIKGKKITKFINNIAINFINLNDTQVNKWSELDWNRTISGFYNHKQLYNCNKAIFKIATYVANENIDISEWPLNSLKILATILKYKLNHNHIHQALKKVVTTLCRSEKDMDLWPIKDLALSASGIICLPNSHSEEFVLKAAKLYISKHNYSEHEYGLMILKAICQMPLESNDSIETGIRLALILSSNKNFKYMNKMEKINFYWYITILYFAVTEKQNGIINNEKWVVNKANALVKIIPKIKQDSFSDSKGSISPWQVNFINIMHYGIKNKSVKGKPISYNASNYSYLEHRIYEKIKNELGDSFKIYEEYCIKGFPVDIFITSGTVELGIEIDGPHHFFTDKKGKISKRMKDRFIDYIISTKMNYKLMRINYMDILDIEDLEKVISKIRKFFYPHNK